MSLIPQLRKFMLDSNGKFGQRRWLRDDIAEIFVRRGYHNVDPYSKTVMKCLDIANINVYQEHQGKGVLTAFLQKAEDFVDRFEEWDGIYVENVLPPRLQRYFRNREGYIEVDVMSQITELATFFRPKKSLPED